MIITIIKSKVKKLFLIITGQVLHLKSSIRCSKVWYGNNYGGFYVCPDFINKNSIVYSFGIGEDISFDRAIIDNHGCHVFGFDPTPKTIKWLKTQKLPSKFHFSEFGIDVKSGIVDFYLPKNPDHVSGSIVIQNNICFNETIKVEMKSISDIMKELDHTHIDILKMDIEGAEYTVIENIIDSVISINQILIEFHDRFVEGGKVKTINTIEMLKRKGYEIFAVSDTFEEVSFIDKRLFSNKLLTKV